jgi:hypothetical protein
MHWREIEFFARKHLSQNGVLIREQSKQMTNFQTVWQKLRSIFIKLYDKYSGVLLILDKI